MKKLIYYQFLLLSAVLMFSCSDGTIGDTFAEDYYQPKGSLISASNVNGCFLVDPTISVVTFDVASTGEEASSADIYSSYNGSPASLVTTVSPVPSSATVDMVDVVAAAGVSDIAAGDVVTISMTANSASGASVSSNVLNFNVGCVSSLAGNHPFVASNLVAANSASPCPTGTVEGVVTFTDLGCGVYGCSDVGFGQYESSCWNDSPATDGGASFTDVCNVITSGGADQYGLIYEWTITKVEGPDLYISWVNDYADSGDVVITKEDGSDWPALTSN